MFNSCNIFFTHIISNIIYVIANCILVIFIIANMIVISIVKLPKANIALYLILFFLLIILAILGGILICYVRRNDLVIQAKIKILSIVALILVILLLVLTIVEEIIISIDYSKIKRPDCFIDKAKDQIGPLGEFIKQSNTNLGINSYLKRILLNDEDITGCIDSYLLKSSKNYSYFTLTFLELISIVSIIYWIQNKKKHADQPIQTNTQMIPNSQQVVVNQNPMPIANNNVYVVSPGQQFYPNYYPQQQVYMYNQIPNSNLYYNSNLNINNQGQQYIENNNNQNFNNNNPANQHVENNNGKEQNNINGDNVQNHVLDENINNANSSGRQVYN